LADGAGTGGEAATTGGEVTDGAGFERTGAGATYGVPLVPVIGLYHD
jgi:hypothetical protein